MSIEKFVEAVHGNNVQGALDALQSVDNPNEKFESLLGGTPLSYATRFEKFDMVDPLLEIGLDPNVFDEGYWNWSPLHYAVISRSIETFNKLINAGASMAQATYGKIPFISIAIHNGDVDFCRLLIDLGVDVNKADDRGSIPIVSAAEKGHMDIWEILLNAGADLNAVSSTILHSAAKGGSLHVCDFLIKQGLDVNSKMVDGFTPLHYAAIKDHPEVCKLLREAGADLTAETEKGYTPIDLAKQRGYTKVVSILK